MSAADRGDGVGARPLCPHGPDRYEPLELADYEAEGQVVVYDPENPLGYIAADAAAVVEVGRR